MITVWCVLPLLLIDAQAHSTGEAASKHCQRTVAKLVNPVQLPGAGGQVQKVAVHSQRHGRVGAVQLYNHPSEAPVEPDAFNKPCFGVAPIEPVGWRVEGERQWPLQLVPHESRAIPSVHHCGLNVRLEAHLGPVHSPEKEKKKKGSNDSINSLRPNNDPSQTSHCNIKSLSVSEVMRIDNMITQVRFY